MMGIKERRFDPLPRDTSLEELVPEDNRYRRLEAGLDLSFVRELVAPLYARGGRPSVDPVVFFKLQLVMFFEGLRSERELMRVAADRLSVRWYLGYDLHEPLPDHSNLTRARERFGLRVFRCFFEAIVEMCAEAGLVWGEELYFDATKVDANASADSMKPRFAVEAHLSGLFEEEGPEPRPDATGASGGTPLGRASEETREDLVRANAGRHDWLSSAGRPRRGVVRGHYRRKADFVASATDPDASLMQRRTGGSHPGYHAHYVVDGGKARVILAALVTPSEVMENQPMLDLLWRSRFRWRLRPRRVRGDTTYGTAENVKALEDAGIRALVPLPDFGKRTPFFGKKDFVYDAEKDVYVCPRGEDLRRYARVRKERIVKYRAAATICNACPEKGRCTNSSKGRVVSRGFDEGYLEKVRSYHGTAPYEKAVRKRRVWVEPMFAEAKDWHGMRRFRLRGLERVNAEVLLTAAGQNVKRLLAYGGRSPRRPAKEAALRKPGPAWRGPIRARGHLAGSVGPILQQPGCLSEAFDALAFR